MALLLLGLGVWPPNVLRLSCGAHALVGSKRGLGDTTHQGPGCQRVAPFAGKALRNAIAYGERSTAASSNRVGH